MTLTGTRRRRRLFAVPALAAVAALVLAGCGARAGDTPAPSASGAVATESCVDTSGDTIKLGFLNSLTGGMAISEQTVSNVLHMAADEINADGGILGKQIEYVQEDGATDWPTFAEKTEKMLTQDCVGAIFGGWTSSSRKAVKPVVEEHNGLFFYPVQYEGLESSPNIYYTGATTNQQIIPALDFLAAEGVETLFLAGSDYVFPRTANAIIKLYAAELGIEIVGEEYVPREGRLDHPGGEDRRSEAGLRLQHDQRFVERRLRQGLLRRLPPRRQPRSSRSPSPRKRRLPWATRSPATTRRGTTSSRWTHPTIRTSSSAGRHTPVTAG